MDKHKNYADIEDYDPIIENYKILFDDAIGYKVAMMVLELFMTTRRSNLHERNARLSINNLKLELEGFKNDQGHLVASGLVQKYNLAVKKAVNKIFPFEIIVQNGTNW